jgi:hypothetical protein
MQKGLKELQVLKVRCSDTVAPYSGMRGHPVVGGACVERMGLETDNTDSGITEANGNKPILSAGQISGGRWKDREAAGRRGWDREAKGHRVRKSLIRWTIRANKSLAGTDGHPPCWIAMDVDVKYSVQPFGRCRSSCLA